jgi:hypothetical protein
MTKIVDGGGFAHEFRIHTDTEIFPGSLTGLVLKQGQNNILDCSRQHRTADDHNMEFVRFSQQFTDLLDNPLYLS